MNVTIVEDEIPAADYLKNLLLRQQIVDIHEIIIIDTVQEAVKHFNEEQPDLVFLDVHLADGSSLEILNQVTITAPVIFTTAYDKYVMEAFKVFTIDYLLKPFEEVALIEALRKLEAIKAKINTEKNTSSSQFLPQEETYQQQFLINYANEIRTINAVEIAYFYGSGKHLFIYTVKRESFLYNGTIRDVSKKLDPDRFFKINRNYVVSIHSIKKVVRQESSKLHVELVPPPPDTNKVTISKSEVRAFKDWLNH